MRAHFRLPFVRRWLPWLVVAVVAAVALTVGSEQAAAPQTLQERTVAVADQVRCPVCVGETVAQSDAAPAVTIRHDIRRELAAGEKPSAILAGIAAIYGPGYLEKPQTSGLDLWLWVLPVAATLAAAAGLAAAFVWWGRRRRADPVASEADRLLVAGSLDSLAGPGERQ